MLVWISCVFGASGHMDQPSDLGGVCWPCTTSSATNTRYFHFGNSHHEEGGSGGRMNSGGLLQRPALCRPPRSGERTNAEGAILGDSEISCDVIR